MKTLAADIVRVLREEIHFLLAAGASLVQLDEPVLTEVVFSGAKNARSFMCGALSERGEAKAELGFARELLNVVVDGLPAERLAVHVCRGNWSPNETHALSGSYAPLLETLGKLNVGTLLLEFATDRAGDLELAAKLPDRYQLGIGVANQKAPEPESESLIAGRIQRAVQLLGKDRLLLTPDCGFATFADAPITASPAAEKILANIVQARNQI